MKRDMTTRRRAVEGQCRLGNMVALCAVLACSVNTANAQRTVAGVVALPQVVTGGYPFTIQVFMTSATGGPVALQVFSHNQAAAPFSAETRVVLDGMSVALFVFPTAPVDSDTNVAFSVVPVIGSSLGAPSTGSVTVLAPIVSEFALAPDPVVGGSTVVGTVHLNGPSPPTGAKVHLTTAQPGAITVPTEVVVPPGQGVFEFEMVTKPVPLPTQIVVTAKGPAQSVGTSASARVDPPGPIELDLGAVGGIGPQPEPPNKLWPGDSLEGRVRLNGPAPANGISLTLDSSNASAATFPASVFIAAGGSQAEFKVTASSVTEVVDVTLRATNPTTGAEAQDTFTVEPATVDALALPSAVIGGQMATATVFLRGMAPAGGVSLTPAVDGDPTRVTLPGVIIVPAGQRQASFDFSTRRVAAPKTPTIQVITDAGATASDTFELLTSRPGDVDGNGALDGRDYETLAICLEGPASAATASCRSIFAVAELATTVDLRDASVFLNEFTGELAGKPRIHVVVDETVAPVLPELLPLDGAGPAARPLARIVDETGAAADFVENELMLITETPEVLDAFVARWQGQVIDSTELFDPGRPNARFSLVRIDTGLASVASLVDDLTALNSAAGERATQLRASSPTALRLLSAAAKERRGGLLVGPNWIPLPQGISDRKTAEAPTGPGSYVPNAFCWDYMNAGSVKNIGVTEAWRVLESSGRLVPNSVEIAVVDGGFRITPTVAADLPNITVRPDPATDLTTVVPNSFGSRFHGVNVLSAAMAIPDNNIGSAGPGGPVARATIFVAGNGSSRFQDMFTLVKSVLREAGVGTAKIFNFSGTVDVPGPVGAFADLLNAIFDLFDIIRDDIVIFASAGNDGTDVDKSDPIFGELFRTKFLPCELANVTCVGGIDRGPLLVKHPDSNFGHEDVDLWAPFNVWVGPDPDSAAVHEFNGTSAASPYAAGVAALLFAANPGLSARSVEQILRDTARTDSPDSRVRRMINARAAVLDERVGLPGEPPSICIISPDDGTPCGLVSGSCPTAPVGPAAAVSPPTFRKGVRIYVLAEIADRELGAEFCPEPEVVWTSDRDGEIARGLTSDTVLLRSTGLHTITATVEDCHGFTASDQVTVNVVNDPPTVRLLKPLDGLQFCVGESIEFAATAFDVNEPPSYRLPPDNIEWTSDLEGHVLFHGESGTRFLGTAGVHRITVTARDPNGATDTDSVEITVHPSPCDFILGLQIVEPPNDILVCNHPDFHTDGFDATVGLRYADVVLEAESFDVEDGVLAGSALSWTTDQTALQPPSLGTGAHRTVRLYQANGTNCTVHRVTVTATDSDGNTKQVTRVIRVWTLI